MAQTPLGEHIFTLRETRHGRTRLLGEATLILYVLATVLGIAAVWMESGKIGGTAGIIAGLGTMLGFVWVAAKMEE